MNKHWQSGVLLGVSLALLLAGGVALAAGLSLTVDPYCFHPLCEDIEPPPGYYTMFTLRGHPTEGPYLICQEWFYQGHSVGEFCGEGLPLEDPAVAYLVAFCDGIFYIDSGQGFQPVMPYSLGPWTVKVWVEGMNNLDQDVSAEAIVAGPVGVDFVVAEDCSVYEFVPEPGTIALLGSGLAGLAGYAALRWRTRN